MNNTNSMNTNSINCTNPLNSTNASRNQPDHHPHASMYDHLLSLLAPQPGERILDLGAGNGDMLARLHAAGAVAVGIDASEAAVSKAREKHPELDIQVADARNYRPAHRFDAIVSHATLHWIPDPQAVTRTLALSLRDGGRFVTEFAASGNTAIVLAAIQQALEEHGYTWAGRNPWYHPTIGEYTSLLEQQGFRVMSAQHFDLWRPLNIAQGIRRWLQPFDHYFFHDVLPEHKTAIYDQIEAAVRPQLMQDDQWMLDTSRIRVVAIKQPH